MIEIGAKTDGGKDGNLRELTAQVAGSGMLPVFGTPFMTRHDGKRRRQLSCSSFWKRARAAWAPI